CQAQLEGAGFQCSNNCFAFMDDARDFGDDDELGQVVHVFRPGPSFPRISGNDRHRTIIIFARYAVRTPYLSAKGLGRAARTFHITDLKARVGVVMWAQNPIFGASTRWSHVMQTFDANKPETLRFGYGNASL